MTGVYDLLPAYRCVDELDTAGWSLTPRAWMLAFCGSLSYGVWPARPPCVLVEITSLNTDCETVLRPRLT